MLKTIYRFAFLSRAVTIVLGILTYTLTGSYDSSAEIQLDSTIAHPLHAFLRWDALYFLHIAEHGYVYEQETAFFPGMPYMARFIAHTVYWPLQKYLGMTSTLLLAGITISNISFVLAAGALYRLTLTLLPHNKKLAALSALAFCLSPPAMFMSSFYTESAFAFLSFTGMLWMAQKKYLRAALIWGVASIVRSNAIIYSGFFLYQLVWIPLIHKHKTWLTDFIQAMMYCLFVCSGFLLFQYYCYLHFCVLDRPWCSSPIPLLYSFVQKEYWDVGFMSYYELKQIPNFILAAPIILLSLSGLKTFIEHNPKKFFSIGVLGQSEQHEEESTYFSDRLSVYIYLWAFLLLYVMTSMHIQVIIRFFTSLPPLYWYVGYVWDQGFGQQRQRWKACGVLGYFVLYGLVGIVLFSHFLPPA